MNDAVTSSQGQVRGTEPAPDPLGLQEPDRCAIITETLAQVDKYKQETKQFGSASCTLTYQNGKVVASTVSDAVRLTPGSRIMDAGKLVLEWLSAVIEQENATAHDGHEFTIEIELSGVTGCIKRSKCNRARTDKGPHTDERPVSAPRVTAQ